MSEDLKRHDNTSDAATATIPAITVRGHYAWVPWSVFQNVQGTLEANEVQYKPNSHGGHDQTELPREFYPTDQEGNPRSIHGRIKIAAGLVPRISRSLQMMGKRFELRDRSNWPSLPQPTLEWAEDWSMRVQGYELLRTVCASQRGQVFLSRPEDLPELIEGLLVFLPDDFALVVVKDAKAAHALKSKFSRFCPRPSIVCADAIWHDRKRKSVEGPAIGRNRHGGKYRIILFANPESALLASSDKTFLQHPHRPFVFVPEDLKLSRSDTLRLESVCGEIIFPRHPMERSKTEVRVCAIQAPPQSPTSLQLPAPTRIASHIIYNDVRNDFIARIAWALEQRDISLLAEMGVRPKCANSFFPSHSSAPRVLVVVDDSAHARELRKRLSEWMVHDTPCVAHEYNIDELNWIEFARRAIATRRWIEHVHLVTDFVIVATGAATSWLRNLGPHRFVESRNLTVIDIGDCFDQRAVRDTETRLQQYKRFGWSIIRPRKVLEDTP